MSKCAKCGKSLPLDNPEKVPMGAGMSVYGRKNHPYICVKCWFEWTEKVIPKYNRKYGQNWASHWKERFEEWLGYEWKNVDLKSREKVVFT